MSTSPIPGAKAYPLDQGKSSTCKCHANDAADQLADGHVDIDQNLLAQLLVTNNKAIGSVWTCFWQLFYLYETSEPKESKMDSSKNNCKRSTKFQ